MSYWDTAIKENIQVNHDYGGGELAGAITHIPLTPSNDVFKVFFLQHQSLLRYAQKCFGRVMIFKIYIHFTPTPPPGKKITDIASN